MSYSSGTRGLGNCQRCGTRSEVAFWNGKMTCDDCAKTTEQPKPTQQTNNYDSSEPHGFQSFKGSYVNLNGKRYELKAAPKIRCKHKMLEWLNEGPRKCPFCPECAMLIYPENLPENDERNTTNEESDRLAEDERTILDVFKAEGGTDADKGLAGLSGSDEQQALGDRVETSGWDDGTDEATRTLDTEAKVIRIKSPSDEQS